MATKKKSPAGCNCKEARTPDHEHCSACDAVLDNHDTKGPRCKSCSMSTVSPTPWFMHKTSTNDQAMVCNSLGDDWWEGEHFICTAGEANAEFIVRACNLHEELLAALDNLLALTLDEDLAQGIELTEREQEARKTALALFEKANGNE